MDGEHAAEVEVEVDGEDVDVEVEVQGGSGAIAGRPALAPGRAWAQLHRGLRQGGASREVGASGLSTSKRKASNLQSKAFASFASKRWSTDASRTPARLSISLS